MLCLAMLASLLLAGEATAGNVVSFSAPVTTSVPPNGSSVAAGDFNSDGDPDLAIASDASATVTIMPGSFAGTFGRATSITVPGGATAVAVGEFNGDSDPDLAVVGTSGTISTFLGATGSAFSTGQTMTGSGCPAAPCPSFPVDVEIGDLNGDNDPELVVANQGSDNVSVFTGADAARFLSTPTVVPVGDGPGSVAIGNFNGDVDSDPDLAVTNHGQLSSPAADTVSILTGTGGATISFSAPANVTVGDYPTEVVAGDFNQNKDPDLAVVNTGSGTGGPATVSILTGAAGAAFTVTSTLQGGSQAIAIGDFNNDLDPDLVTAGIASNNLAVFVGSAGASFLGAQNFPGGAATQSLAVADFDADALADVAGANYSPASVSTVLNTSDLAPPETTITSGPSGLTNDSTPTFEFTSAEGGSTFQCRTGVGLFASCTSPHTTAALADGARTFEVRAIDAAGNVDATPAIRNLTVDSTPPDTTIDSGPSGLTNDSTPTFTFSSEGRASFQCRVDTAAFAPCSSPSTTAPLADGAHTFEVRAVDAAGNVDTTPATRNLSVDAAGPETTIGSGPSGATDDNTPTFAFTSSEPGASFQCRVDAAAFAPCSSPLTTAPLADGAHTFEVRAVDAAGNVDPTEASRTFTVDTAAPETTIASGPSGSTNDDTPTFEFTSSEAGARFQCRVDTAAFAPCTSPFTTAALAAGAHTFEVRAVDGAGNVDATPASRTVTVDTAAPDTTVTAGPTGSTNDNTPTFTFTSSEPGATFQCRVDAAAFAPCSSPVTPPVLADGAHTFEVRAVDAAGNVDATPAIRNVTVDTDVPETTIGSGPSGATNDNTPTFTFTSSEPGATFQCRVNTGAFAPCTSPHTTAALADGTSTFEVRAVDAAGNVDATPASRAVNVDAAPPDTVLASGPSGATNDSTPTFTFTASKPGSTFECRVGAAAFAPCTSPHTTATLSDGPKTFEVRAVDAVGNADPTSATRSFTVDTMAPETNISAGPTGKTSDTTPTFAFSSSEPGAKFQCRLDQGAWLPCSSPHTLPVLSPGSHSFRVRSIDAAGNVDASPASTIDPTAALRSFTVAAAAPGPPVLGRRFNAEPVKGDVFVSTPPGRGARASASVPGLKGRNFIPLREARQVPVGSIFDTRKGTVRLTSARNSRGATQSAQFLGGVFQVLQSRRRSARGLTELRLKGASFRGCGRAKGKRAGAAASRRRIRRVRGSGRGRFRTRGRYSSATVRGTIWTVTDRCDGTLTKVTRGKVAVRDLRRRKTVLLPAGKSYFARARR